MVVIADNHRIEVIARQIEPCVALVVGSGAIYTRDYDLRCGDWLALMIKNPQSGSLEP